MTGFILSIVSSLLAACAMASAIAAQGAHDPPATQDALVDYLRGIEVGTGEMDTTIEITLHDSAPVDGTNTTEKNVLGVREMRLVTSGNKWSMQVVARNTGVDRTVEVMYVWDGEKCVSRISGDLGVVMRSTFQYHMGWSLLSMMNRNGSIDINGSEPLSEVVANSIFVDAVRSDGAMLYHLQTPMPEESGIRRTVQLELTEVSGSWLPRLLMIEVWSLTSGEENAKLLGTEAWRIEEWGQLDDGSPIAMEAMREVIRQLPGDATQVRGVTEFRRTALTRPDVSKDDPMFAIEPKVGDVVC
ncbi:MAG: hypothetical protein ACR2GY_07715 [Phycisphaerales bacterium]